MNFSESMSKPLFEWGHDRPHLFQDGFGEGDNGFVTPQAPTSHQASCWVSVAVAAAGGSDRDRSHQDPAILRFDSFLLRNGLHRGDSNGPALFRPLESGLFKALDSLLSRSVAS
jgi:hypothetical protein